MANKDMKNMDHKNTNHQEMDHKNTDHSNMDHMNMDHSKMDHGNHDMGNMDHGGHDMSGMDHGQMMEHGGHMMNMGDLKLKFWVSLVLMIPVILMTPFMGVHMPFEISFPGSLIVVAILSSILYFYGGQPFFSGALGEIKSKKPAMMSLITMGISVAYFYSIYSVFAHYVLNMEMENFFWELSTLIVIMLLGHWIEMNTMMNAGSALNQLAKLLPNQAHLVTEDDNVKDVSVNDLNEGDVIIAKAGEKIPADGVIISGQSNVNESLVTGEAKQVAKAKDDNVIGGSNNDEGSIRIKITGTGDSGYLAKVMNMVNDAQGQKSQNENRANKVAGYLFYAAIIIALIAFISWSLVNGVSYAVMITVSTLIIACPHALGLAIPLIVSRMTSIAATHGLLVRNRTALEGIKNVRYALMDKTGTLTEGKFEVNDYKSLDDNHSDQDILGIMGSVEQESSHPLATGIVAKAKEQNVQLKSADNVSQITGVGVTGSVDGNDYKIVANSYLNKNNIEYDHDQFNQLASRGNSVSFLLKNDQLIGIIAEGDQIKSTSKAMVDYLKQQNIQPVMLTGDNEMTAKSTAKNLAIDYRAELLPEDKQKIVSEYQNSDSVMFIGDGINDAPSLAKADLGVAIGSGTDVAIDSADVVLVNSDPQNVIDLVKLAHRSDRKMTENLWWGAGYNIVALPLAAGVLAFAGIIITPPIGAIVMSLSTVIVALNAMTLKIE